MNEEKRGVQAALDRVGAAAPEQASETQGELLPLPFDRSDAARRDKAQGERTGKPGRPAGSLNRRTEDFAKFILSRYTSPLIGLAETYSRALEDLKADLGCDRLEAFKLQVDCMKALAPYIHQKMPVAVEGAGVTLPTLVVVTPELGAQLGLTEGDAIPIPEPLNEDEEPKKDG